MQTLSLGLSDPGFYFMNFHSNRSIVSSGHKLSDFSCVKCGKNTLVRIISIVALALLETACRKSGSGFRFSELQFDSLSWK